MTSRNSVSDGDGNTHFGYASIPLSQKQARVDDVFHKVADRYDLMNDLMSAGLHRAWKDIFVANLAPPKRGNYRHLDVAGGTGDIAFRIARATGRDARIIASDINVDMLRVGRMRAMKAGLEDRVAFEEANAESLPYPDRTFDGYTIAFGIRNVPRIDLALSEAYRTLKRGGRFLCLEFSQVRTPVLDALYDAYSFNVIPTLGRIATGDGEPYRYLVESIRRFPSAERFALMIEQAGFSRASFQPLSGGIVAIHSGWKL